MKETKNNIARAALKLFNGNGYVNVRLQHIADEAFVSVGNLAYHFSNKQEILLYLYHEIKRLQKGLLHELNIVPLFEHLDRHWCNVFEVQMEYKFFYIDTLEILRSSPSIQKKHQDHVKWEIYQLEQMLRFNLSRGSLSGPDAGTGTERLACLLWMCENTWYHQSLIQGREPTSALEFKETLWSLIRPYFSEIGHQEYLQVQAMNKTENIL